MSEALEEQREETAPVEARLPADTPTSPIGVTPASSDDLDSLLEEFDAATGKQPEAPASDNTEQSGAVSDELDKFIADFAGPTADQKRIGELEAEIGSVRAAELDRQSRADFEGFSKKLQAECGPNVDDQFARTNLLAMAAENPALEHAWRFRHLTDDQLRAADQEFRRLEALHMRVQLAPDDPRKVAAMAQIERRGQELGLMMNARAILNTVWRDVQKRASKVLPAIDPIATADHDLIAQSIRDGQGPIDLREPAPDFASMDDRTFREYTRKTYGF
jgi:hypothetical protein